jgi:hypothetical protein
MEGKTLADFLREMQQLINNNPLLSVAVKIAINQIQKNKKNDNSMKTITNEYKDKLLSLYNSIKNSCIDTVPDPVKQQIFSKCNITQFEDLENKINNAQNAMDYENLYVCMENTLTELQTACKTVSAYSIASTSHSVAPAPVASTPAPASALPGSSIVAAAPASALPAPAHPPAHTPAPAPAPAARPPARPPAARAPAIADQIKQQRLKKYYAKCAHDNSNTDAIKNEMTTDGEDDAIIADFDCRNKTSIVTLKPSSSPRPALPVSTLHTFPVTTKISVGKDKDGTELYVGDTVKFTQDKFTVIANIVSIENGDKIKVIQKVGPIKQDYTIQTNICTKYNISSATLPVGHTSSSSPPGAPAPVAPALAASNPTAAVTLPVGHASSSSPPGAPAPVAPALDASNPPAAVTLPVGHASSSSPPGAPAPVAPALDASNPPAAVTPPAALPNDGTGAPAPVTRSDAPPAASSAIAASPHTAPPAPAPVDVAPPATRSDALPAVAPPADLPAPVAEAPVADDAPALPANGAPALPTPAPTTMPFNMALVSRTQGATGRKMPCTDPRDSNNKQIRLDNRVKDDEGNEGTVSKIYMEDSDCIVKFISDDYEKHKVSSNKVTVIQSIGGGSRPYQQKYLKYKSKYLQLKNKMR